MVSNGNAELRKKGEENQAVRIRLLALLLATRGNGMAFKKHNVFFRVA
jgi:hypothetical protein